MTGAVARRTKAIPGRRYARSVRDYLRRRRDGAARWGFRQAWLSRLARREHLLCLGDSHTRVFWGWNPNGWWVRPITVGGATASGVRNPNSATNALQTFNDALDSARPFQHVMVMLGEVDCGYIMWRRAKEQDRTIDEQLDETVTRFTAFLAEVSRREPASIMVMSVPLPTLPDDTSDWGEIAQRRSDTPVPQAARTELTLRFNLQLAEICQRAGYTFVDSTSAQLDPSTGLVRQDLVRHGEGDHHLPDGPYRQLIVDALDRTTG